ncbi:hypothetical protein BMS3Abin02_01561 [bacterium BMS3Abin02]|nr:hypothetical protein BMS3Abin02_01561 [bacterium BMS3Abin02]
MSSLDAAPKRTRPEREHDTALRQAQELRLSTDMKTAQTRLGHTDPRLTRAIYAQATIEADRTAAERLGRRFLHQRNQGRGLA